MTGDSRLEREIYLESRGYWWDRMGNYPDDALKEMVDYELAVEAAEKAEQERATTARPNTIRNLDDALAYANARWIHGEWHVHINGDDWYLAAEDGGANAAEAPEAGDPQ